MKIAFYSPSFYPNVGGLENVVLDLATEMQARGVEITVLTKTENPEADDFPFPVIRQASWWKEIHLMRKSDAVMQFCISLKGIPGWWLSGRPLFVSHQTAYRNGWRGRLKTWVSNRWAVNISCSEYIAGAFHESEVVPNPYNHHLWKTTTPLPERRRDIVFLGRLVSDKGVDLLVDALSILRREHHMQPLTTIIGPGPERGALEQRVQQAGVEDQLTFTGPLRGEKLVKTVNDHRIMAVPSRWKEPFGIVALEGLACNCLVVGSEAGGLKDAIGPCGLTFPNGQLAGLVDALKTVLTDTDGAAIKRAAIPTFLQRHRRSRIAEDYLQIISAHLQKPIPGQELK